MRSGNPPARRPRQLGEDVNVELSCGHLATWAWSENRTPKVGATFPCHVCEGAAVKPQASAP